MDRSSPSLIEKTADTQQQSSTKKESKDRIYYLDNAKAFVSILIVVSHAASVYTHNWQPKLFFLESPHLTNLGNILLVSRAFHMPLFALVAGFFTMYGLIKYPPTKYLARRSRRILIPFLVSLPLFGFSQDLILHLYENPWDRQGLFNAIRWYPHHLWFLQVVILYSIAVLAIYQIFQIKLLHKTKARFMSVSRYAVANAATLVFAGVAIHLVFWPLQKQLFAINILSCALTGYFFEYFPYFLLGTWLYNHQDRFNKIMGQKRTILYCLFIDALIVASMKLHLISWQVPLDKWIIEATAGWTSTIIVLCMFRLLVNRQSKIWDYFTNASYSIYIVHLPLVLLSTILIQTCLADKTLYVQCFTTIAISLVSTYIFYELFIKRVKISRILISGETK